MDLNHARLPIPPRWQVDFKAAAASRPPDQEDLRFYSTGAMLRVKRYSSFAFIVIFAFRTFDTGHPFSAASAYF
jgi:hypothetical protein